MSEVITHHPPTFWQQVFSTTKRLWGSCLPFCLCAIFIPQLLLSFGLAPLYSESIQEIKDFTEAINHKPAKDVMQLLSIASRSFLPLIGWHILAVVLVIYGFASCLLIAKTHIRGHAPISIFATAKKSLWLLCRKLLVITLVATLLIAIVQAVLPLMSFAMMPLVLAPTFAIVYECGVWQSLKRSLLVKIIPDSTFQMGLYIQACGLGAICYLAHLLTAGIFFYLSDLDKWAPLNSVLVEGYPFTIAYLLGASLSALLQTSILYVTAIATVTFLSFHEIREFRTRRSMV